MELMSMNLNGYTITAALNRSGIYAPFDDGRNPLMRNSFKVTVGNGNAHETFDYYMSNKDYTDGKLMMDDADLKDAFCNILSEAVSSECTFIEFCDSLGYDTNDKRALRTFRACGYMCSQLSTIGIESNDMLELIDLLQ